MLSLAVRVRAPPQIAADPHTVEFACVAEVPQAAALPHNALEPQTAAAPSRKTEVPHTAVAPHGSVPQIGVVPQGEVSQLSTSTDPVPGSTLATGDAAVLPEGTTSTVFRAAQTSR